MPAALRPALAALLALTAVLPLSPPAPLPSAIAPAHALTAVRPPAARVASPQRAWGVSGAIICGVGVRITLTTGPNVAVLAATIGGCVLAALDVLSTQE